MSGYEETSFGPVGTALLATLVISLAPHIALFVIPIFKQEAGKQVVNKKLLKVLVCFAVGGLLGDAFLHLIPHAFDPHTHSHDIEVSAHQDHHHHHNHDHHDHHHHHDHDRKLLHTHDSGNDGEAHEHHHHDHEGAKPGEHAHDHGHRHHHDHEGAKSGEHAHDHSHHASGTKGEEGYSANPDPLAHEHHHHHHDAHDHSKGLKVGLHVLLGMLTFFVIQKYAASRAESGHGHSHGGHSHSSPSETRRPQLLAGESRERSGRSVQDIRDEQRMAAKRASSILNIIADAAHNFTDGLAIAASFLVSRNVGMTTSLAVLFHEVPHEIGDYAILLQSGYSWWAAMLMQMLTAVGAFAGCWVGIYFSGVGEAASTWILPFTAGGFIYIATVDIVPDLLEDTSFKQTLVEVLAMCVGVGFMVVIALYE